ncbi:MAG: hypothetical protein HQK51_11680 [Oligoflexia bacterium]|nr:hypothetical protein [Oligoflexia bacterium]
MNTMITKNHDNFPYIKQELIRECQKLEKYFLSNPVVNCKIYFIKGKFYIRLSLTSGNKHFTEEVHGTEIDICIKEVVRRLVIMIKFDKNVFLRRGENISIKNFNFLIFPPSDKTVVYPDFLKREHQMLPSVQTINA